MLALCALPLTACVAGYYAAPNVKSGATRDREQTVTTTVWFNRTPTNQPHRRRINKLVFID